VNDELSIAVWVGRPSSKAGQPRGVRATSRRTEIRCQLKTGQEEGCEMTALEPGFWRINFDTQYSAIKAALAP
jgi:hypothetical protein